MTPRERYAKENARKYKDPKTGRVKTRKPSTSKERRKMNLTGRSLDQVRAQRKKRDARAKRKARRASASKAAPKTRTTTTSSRGPMRPNARRGSSSSRRGASGGYSRWRSRYGSRR